MATTLGKRARALDAPSSPLISRKRRTRFSSTNDENADPELVQNIRENVSKDGFLHLGELEDPFNTSKQFSTGASVPVKHTIKGGRIALSPIKTSKDSESSKTLQSELEDVNQLPTPKTPRHRDALSKKIPVTPRHRVTAMGRPLTPRTPRTSSTPSNAPTVYNCARQLFVRSANPGRLIGREEERSELNKFLQAGIEYKSGRCMYVSGPPGTGKSALVGEVCGDLQEKEDVHTAYINCMSIKNSRDIYCKLIEDLGGNMMEPDGNELSTLKAMFLPKKSNSNQVYVVTLDEIDHLLTLDLEILYTLFEWSLHRSSRLILIGIANALDLTDRFLPRLKARNLKPQLLPFLPYTVPQIASVITAKLQSLVSPSSNSIPNFVPFLHPTAIQFCSKKVASQTGDLRKAFDIVRRTIDLIEAETKQKHQDNLNALNLQISPSRNAPLLENANLCSPSTLPKTHTSNCTLASSLATLTQTSAPRATIAHIARTTAAAFNNGTAVRLQGLNLQQKAALCALLALEKKLQSTRNVLATPSKSSSATPMIRKVYETYCELCKRENALHPLTATEFGDVVGSLEMLGLVGGGELMGRGTPSKKIVRAEERRVGSSVGEKEVEGILEGVGGGILRGLLKGDV